MRCSIPLLFALTGTATTVQAGVVAPVVGGSTVPAGKWPDTVAVIGAKGTCTGTLIAPTVVLTAGHCVKIEAKQVIANTTDYAAQGGLHANVAKVIAYPSWETSYDVAVVVLAKPIAAIAPRRIATACTVASFTKAAQVHLVGFGLTDEDGRGTNTVLHEAMASVIDPECTLGNGCQAAVSPGGEFVAGGEGTDSCFGDSGGPAYLDTEHGPVVIGVVSRGIDGSMTACGGGGVYVRTDKLAEWIAATAGTEIEADDCVSAPPDASSTDGSSGSSTSGDGSSSSMIGGCSTTGSASADPTLAIVLAFSVSRSLRRRAQLQ